jgi:hypothetical protein
MVFPVCDLGSRQDVRRSSGISIARLILPQGASFNDFDLDSEAGYPLYPNEVQAETTCKVVNGLGTPSVITDGSHLLLVMEKTEAEDQRPSLRFG